MATIREVIDIIEKFAPRELAEDFDNCGLKIGGPDEKVTGVLVTVDTNLDVVAEAKDKGCNLIIEHHPSIWRPLKSIDCKIPLNATLIEAAKNGIAIYSAHTNVDYTDGGLNDEVAKKMGLTDVKYVKYPSSARVGKLPKEVTLREYAKFLAELFNDDNVAVIGDIDKKVKKVGVINGGGGSREDAVWETYENGCDVFVTAEVKHNVARLAKDLNYAIIQVGHFTSEAEFLPLMIKTISGAIPSTAVLPAESIGSPYNRRGEIWN